MALTEIRQKIQDVIQPILESKNAFLVDVQVRNESGGKLVQAFVDTDEGITIDLCAEISKELNRSLALGRIVEGPYNLEISSPGIDRPIKLLRQYRKNIGRKYKVRFKTGSEAQSIVGILVDITEDRLTFRPEAGEALTIPFSNIIESKEELPW